MFAYKAPINDGFTLSTLHNGYVWLSLCLQAEAWQFTAGADAILLLFSCLSVTPDPPWADPWPPCIMDPHFRYRVHGRNSKTGVSEQRSVQTNLSVQEWSQLQKSMWLQKIFQSWKNHLGAMCNWIWSPLDWEQLDRSSSLCFAVTEALLCRHKVLSHHWRRNYTCFAA